MKRMFFCGICGISMSALAFLEKLSGNQVEGSDLNYLNKPKCLSEIEVHPQPYLKGIDESDEVVFSSAVRDSEEVIYARKTGKKVIPRGELLGQISSEYNKVIAVAGSHGKTTTTAMIFHVLSDNGFDPTLHLGGDLKGVGNVYSGGKDFFVTEACEYCDNFLYLHPYISVITNVEPEHLDYFKTFENEKKSFKKFEKQSKNCIKKNTYKISKKIIRKDGCISFILEKNNKKYEKINLNIGGEYNIFNAIYCIEVCEKLGLNFDQIKKSLETFIGVRKRCEKIISKYNFKIFVDYAHHPKEIKKSAIYFQEICEGKCVAIFQPHTYSRTKLLFDDFIKSLSLFDEVVCYKTYPARETQDMGFDEKDLARGLSKNGKTAYVCENERALREILKQYSQKDLIIFLGAGDLPDKFDFSRQ